MPATQVKPHVVVIKDVVAECGFFGSPGVACMSATEHSVREQAPNHFKIVDGHRLFAFGLCFLSAEHVVASRDSRSKRIQCASHSPRDYIMQTLSEGAGVVPAAEMLVHHGGKTARQLATKGLTTAFQHSGIDGKEPLPLPESLDSVVNAVFEIADRISVTIGHKARYPQTQAYPTNAAFFYDIIEMLLWSETKIPDAVANAEANGVEDYIQSKEALRTKRRPSGKNDAKAWYYAHNVAALMTSMGINAKKEVAEDPNQQAQWLEAQKMFEDKMNWGGPAPNSWESEMDLGKYIKHWVS